MTSGAILTRYVDATVTVPVGTAIAAPLKTTISAGNVILLGIHLVIPAGPAYLVGWSLWLANQQVVPFAPVPGWIIGDDDKLDFTFDREVGNGLQVVAYNLGQYPHTLRATLKVEDVATADAPTSAPIRIVSL